MTRRELLPGTDGTAERVVGASDLASALSPDHADHFPEVFATARMVALMEMAASRAMAGIGMEGKFYRFEVFAEDDAGEIGRGLHDRAIVRHARLLEGAERRRPRTKT